MFFAWYTIMLVMFSQDEHIVHIPFDFQKMARMMGSSHTNVISSISKVVQQAMDITGIFSYLVHGRHGVHGQNAGPDGRADHEDRGSVSCVDDTVCTMEVRNSSKAQRAAYPTHTRRPLALGCVPPVVAS